MEVEAFLLADAATDQVGKLNVLGAFDSILAPTAPVGHPSFSVALRLRFTKSESGNHPFRITIVDQDGKAIIQKPIDGNIEVSVQNADESAAVNLVANFRDVRFEKFGKYSIDLTLSGKPRGSLPIYVRQAQRPA